MKRLLIISLSVSLLIIAFSVSYYFVRIIPEQQDKKLEAEKVKLDNERDQQLRESEIMIDQMEQRNICINRAKESHRNRWEKSCEKLGRGDDCFLPSDMAKAYIKDLDTEKDNCVNITK